MRYNDHAYDTETQSQMSSGRNFGLGNDTYSPLEFAMSECDRRYVKDQSGHWSEVKILPGYDNGRTGLISVFDYDGTVRKYSAIATIFHNLLVPSSVNSLGMRKKMFFQELSKALSILSRFSKTDYFSDTAMIAEELHEKGTNVLYTLNSIGNTERFLKDKKLAGHFDLIICPEHKDADSLYTSLSEITGKSYDVLKDTLKIAFGDNRCDIEAMDFKGDRSDDIIRVGFESGLEKKLEEFKRECDIFIPEELRPTETASLFYFGATEKIRKKLVSSENEGSLIDGTKTDIFKYLLELYKRHAEKD